MKKNMFIWGLAIILLGGCSGIKVKSDRDKEVDFSKYKTLQYYGWTEESDKILNRFDKERIEKAFGDEFGKRGFSLVKEGGDIVVSLYIVVDQKTSTTAYTNHYGMGGYGYGPRRGWYGGYGGMGSSVTTYNEEDYKVGTLVVDVFDRKTKKLVWQSVGEKTIKENPDAREKNIPKVAAAIMKPFPVAPMK